jgi:molybdenum-dependent DNA-binding transcriptional regulator ModE
MPASQLKYRVPFHAIQVVYFESDEMLPRGSSYRTVWQHFSRLNSSSKISGNLWHHYPPLLKMERSRKMRLGDPSVFDGWLKQDDRPILGGGLCESPWAERPLCDADFHLSLTDASRCIFGKTLPAFHCAVSSQWIERTGESEMLRLFLDNFEVFDASAPLYGLIDLSRPEESFAGMMYTSILQLLAPLNQWVEQANWVNSIEQGKHQARGIYWGNYFGRRLLERLGGAKRMTSGILSHLPRADGQPSAIVREYQNGVFLSLSPKMSDYFPGNPLCNDSNLIWLHRTLCAAGALVGG